MGVDDDELGAVVWDVGGGDDTTGDGDADRDVVIEGAVAAAEPVEVAEPAAGAGPVALSSRLAPFAPVPFLRLHRVIADLVWARRGKGTAMSATAIRG